MTRETGSQPRLRHTACGTDGRFSWSSLGEEDPDEWVVYDHQLGLTHLVDGLAHAVWQLLAHHPQGLDVGAVAACLWHPQLPPDQAVQLHQDDIDGPAHAQERQRLTELLGSMVSVGMAQSVAVQPALSETAFT